MKRLSASLLAKYRKDVEAGRLARVASQHSCVERLGRLLDELAEYSAALSGYNAEARRYERRREVLSQQLAQERQRQAEQRDDGGASVLRRLRSWWQPGGSTPQAAHTSSLAAQQLEELQRLLGPPPQRPASPKGLYLYGPVGTGKTMLMDRFYETLLDAGLAPASRRLHFNAAMLEVHSRMHVYERAAAVAALQHDAVQQAKQAKLAVRRLRQTMRAHSRESSDAFIARSNAAIFASVAQALMRGAGSDVAWPGLAAGVLCFDEVNVSDPFTALALKGIFEALIQGGTVIVATSNRRPSDLNHFGVHEAVFAHFIQRLTAACDEVEVAGADFRRELAGGKLGGDFLHPLTPAHAASLEQRWDEAVTAAGGEQPCVVPVAFGRTLQVARSAGGAARSSFGELCDAPRGASDYCALAQRFHTLFLTDVPVMSFQKRNLARRFITLLDELYNARTRLVCTAEAPPEQLFAASAGDGPTFDAALFEELQFESSAEGSRLRRDVMAAGGVAPVLSGGSAAVTDTFLGGAEEAFAFSRAISRLYEMSRRG